MNKQELVRNEMVKAMKEKDKSKKETLSLLLAALKNAEIDKMGILSESEEDAVVQKEIKQTKETLHRQIEQISFRSANIVLKC